ncbi:unnamed protein product [Discosporangium mesarthrocarpum]
MFHNGKLANSGTGERYVVLRRRRILGCACLLLASSSQFTPASALQPGSTAWRGHGSRGMARVSGTGVTWTQDSHCGQMVARPFRRSCAVTGFGKSFEATSTGSISGGHRLRMSMVEDGGDGDGLVSRNKVAVATVALAIAAAAYYGSHHDPSILSTAVGDADSGGGGNLDVGMAAVARFVMEGKAAIGDTVQSVISGSVRRVEELGPLGPLYYGVLYVAAEMLAIPALPLTASAGYLFGVPGGTTVVLAAATVAAGASFQLGRTFLRKQVEGLLAENPRFQAIDGAIGKEGFRIILLLRLSPIFPFALSNYLYGITSVDFWEYMSGTMIGFFPGTLAYVYTGSLGKSLTDGDLSLPWYGYAAVLAFVAVLLKTVGDIATNAVEEIEAGMDSTQGGEQGGGAGKKR